MSDTKTDESATAIYTTYPDYAEPFIFAVRDRDGTILCECLSIQHAEDCAMAIQRQRDLDAGAPGA